MKAIENLGFEQATPIQREAIPPLLEGRNVIGRARTGSGKTAAFGLPMLQRVIEGGTPQRGLVLAPTRELALQVTEALQSFATELPLSIATIYGGAPYPPQFRALLTATIVVGTPGRILDHLHKGSLDLSQLEVFVLDEADEMLRMGFVDDVTEILAASPAGRQVALFSATMPDPIRRMVESHLDDVVQLQVESGAMTTDHIEQQWMRVPRRFKVEALARVLRGVDRDTVIAFTRTRAACAEVADALTRRGIAADALHGDLNQGARERVLHRLRSRSIDVVVATDVAARGIDVDHITHVINVDLPVDTETYVHRIGRTGRVGRKGTAITFATPKEKRRIHDMARRLRVTIKNVDVPSDAAIAGQQRAQLQRQLTEAMGPGDREAARTWLASMMAESGASAEDVATAAISLLAGPDAFSGELADGPPSWARKVGPVFDSGNGGPRPDDNEVELFFPIGRRRNVRPGDFVGALANEAGIDGQRIGRVNIFDRKTFVGVSRATADHVLARLDEVQIRGNQVPVTMARARTDEERPPSSTYPRRRKHGPGRGNRGHDQGRGRS